MSIRIFTIMDLNKISLYARVSWGLHFVSRVRIIRDKLYIFWMRFWFRTASWNRETCYWVLGEGKLFSKVQLQHEVMLFFIVSEHMLLRNTNERKLGRALIAYMLMGYDTKRRRRKMNNDNDNNNNSLFLYSMKRCTKLRKASLAKHEIWREKVYQAIRKYIEEKKLANVTR